MSIFYFDLRNGDAGVVDVDGIDLRDSAEARDHAIQVARELMRHDEVKKRPWRLDVRDHVGTPLFEVAFAAVDPTLDHLEPEFRNLVESLSASRRRLQETIFKSKLLARGAQAAEARKVRKLYLVAVSGQRI
jgi:hypothetical protein